MWNKAAEDKKGTGIIAHELRHAKQYQETMGLCPNDFFERAELDQFRKEFAHPINYGQPGYWDQTFELDAYAFAGYIMSNLFTGGKYRIVDNDMPIDKIKSRLFFIHEDMPEEEIETSLKEAGLNLAIQKR